MSAEVRARREVIAEILELLPTAVANGTTELVKGSGGTHILRTDRGTLLAQFTSRGLAQFLQQAPDNLRVLSAYIEELEGAAFNDRERRREAEARLNEVRIELVAAASLGVTTRDGMRRIQSAIASVRDRSDRLDT
jgi:hypothetical protein